MSRPPRLPDRDSIPEAERADYDFVVERIESLASRPVPTNPYASACLVSPPFAASLWVYSGRMLAAGESGSYTHAEREHINVVLAHDAGHYEMIEFHLDYAIDSAGIRPEMVQAIWAGREEDLLPDERQLVDFIRAYVAGTVDDEMWAGMYERFGERGAVEYSLMLGYHLMVIRTMQAWATPTASRAEMDEVVRGLRKSDPAAAPYDYEAHNRKLRELAGKAD